MQVSYYLYSKWWSRIDRSQLVSSMYQRYADNHSVAMKREENEPTLTRKSCFSFRGDVWAQPGIVRWGPIGLDGSRVCLYCFPMAGWILRYLKICAVALPRLTWWFGLTPSIEGRYLGAVPVSKFSPERSSPHETLGRVDVTIFDTRRSPRQR